MMLSRQNIERISVQNGVEIPDDKLFNLPEKVLQFGTGVLLRGLPDYFIDKANKQGIFNGRIVVVKSTSTGGTDAFVEQDGLYTTCVRGIEGKSDIEENIINASISRVLSAKDQWAEILHCASNPDMKVVISNTTEVGITLTDDDITATPPPSFPGKLLAFLYHRFKIFSGDITKGMVIIPTELIVDNGKKLKEILVELAIQNKLGNSFLDWLSTSNYFCNSLVDRIVPGKMGGERQQKIEHELGYADQLMIMAEPYRLWAIETEEHHVIEAISFSQVDKGVVLANDIHLYRELKLRLLNGSHSFSCGLAHLCGFATVKEAMDNKYFAGYISTLMMQEIVPAITNDQISPELATEFANKVMDRYRNPHIEHQWLSISVQYSSKMKMRNIPVISRYHHQFGTTPGLMTLGFAGFLVFMKAEKGKGNKFEGNVHGEMYTITDENIETITEKRNRNHTTNGFVRELLADVSLWGVDLTQHPGFADNVTSMITLLETEGAMNTLEKIISPKLAVQPS